MAAVLYMFRTLVDDDIPLMPVALSAAGDRARRLDAQPPPAGLVVAGNCGDVDLHHHALYGAVGRDGRRPVHDENFTFGNDRHQYYETISGGSGAGPASTATRRRARPT